MNRIFKKLVCDGKEFATFEQIKEYSNKLYYNPNNVIKYLISRGFLLKTFKGVFYIKNDDEIKNNTLKYSYFEIVAKALEFKKIDYWYFGLYTALKLNNVNYKKDSKEYIISNHSLVENPIKIMGHKFRFMIFKDTLLKFGIIENGIKYSDLEKTLLDFIYLWRYNRFNERKIIVGINKYIDIISIEKFLKYSELYPESTRSILKKVI